MSIVSEEKLRIGSTCPRCGGILKIVRFGGCGGNGMIKGCESCDAMWIQSSGGLVPTHGGEVWRPLSEKLSEWRKRHAANTPTKEG